MAEASEDEVILKQMEGVAFGGSTADALNMFLSGLQTFGNNFSAISDTLIQFFQATKLFLESFANPLTAALIETIDSLIEALEELNNMGFGSVAVYPWAHGQYPQQLNTEKMDEAMLGLVAAMQGIDIGDVQFSERGFFVQTKNGESLLTPGQEIASGGTRDTFQTKDTVYQCLTGVRNFFHPELWAGSTTPFWLDSPGDAKKRQEQAFADETRMGLGAYDRDDLEQHWSGQAADWAKDTLLEKIEDTQKNLLVRELTPEQAVNKIIKSLSGNTPDDNRPTGSGPYKAYMLMFTLPTINAVIQVIQSFANYFGSVLGDDMVKKLAAPDAKFDEIIKTISLGEPLYKPGEWSRQNEQSEFYYEEADFKPRPLEDGTYKLGGATQIYAVPMFKPGDRIVQTGGILGFHTASAEVVEHLPIIVKNGMILQNRVRVKGVRGEFIGTNHKPLNTASTPIIKSIITGRARPNFEPIFRSDTLEKPIERIDGTFFGTIKEGDTVITEIIPNDLTGQDIRNTCESLTTGPSFVFKDAIKLLLEGAGSKEIIDSYMGFIKTVKKGMVIKHQFLQPMDLSNRAFDFYHDSFFADSEFRINYGELLDVVPSLDVQYHIANIKIDGVAIESTNDLKETDLFNFPPKSDDNKPTMRELTFELGFLNYGGSYDTEFLNIDVSKLISPPNPPDGGGVHSWQTTIPTSSDPKGPPNLPFELISGNKNISPNWKYIRISDIFPAYGRVIKDAIGNVKKFKKQVEAIAKEIDEYIKFLERQIKAIQRLNDQIQQLIAFFSKGLNMAGIYTAQFGGEGIGDFKKKLKNMKMLQTNKNNVNEITLETVETDTVIKDPFTGLSKTVKRKVLKPITKKATGEEPDGEPKPLSELSNLKYSGAIVFLGQGPDLDKFDTFMNNFNGLSTLGKGFLSNLFTKESNIAQRLTPYVYDIQGENADGDFVNIEGLGSISPTGTIRIVFTNEADQLDETERGLINQQVDRTIDFSPRIQMGSISLTNSEDASAHTRNDSIVLYQGTVDEDETETGKEFSQDSVYHQFVSQPKYRMEGKSTSDEDGNFVKQFFNVDLKPKTPLKRSSIPYKIIVKTSIVNSEGQTLKKQYALNLGFFIDPVTVQIGKLIDG